MATNFPISLDNFTNPASGNTLDSPSHSLQHSDVNDAIEAIEAKLGVGASPAGSATAGQVLTISAAGTSGWSSPLREGLIQVAPTSVAVGSGSGSVDANGAVTFTSASSISLNGCFTSSYDNYRIIWNVTSLTNSTGLVIRTRVSGADLSTSTYSYGHFINAYTTSIIGDGSASATGPVIGYSGSQNTRGIVDILNPQNSLNTYGYYWSGSETSTFNGGFRVNNTTSYDGFSFFPQSGNFTGTIRVYGYRN